MRLPARLAFTLALALCAWSNASATPIEALTALAATDSAAEPDEINAFVACRRRPRRQEILLDAASRRVYQTVCGAALWFDGLFGARDLNAALKSYGHVEVSTAYSEFTGSHSRLRFIARVKLPAMEQRLSAFVGVDGEDEFVRDRSEGQALRSRQRVTDDEAFLVGLGYAGVTTDRFQSEFNVGVRDAGLPKVFAQNRITWIPYSDIENRLILRLTPFWNNRDLYGVTTHTSLDHIVGEAFLLRWSTAATMVEETNGLDWRTALILYQNLLGSRALAYEVFIRGAPMAPEPLGEYGARTVFREPFFHDRLFAEVVVGYSWPRDDPALAREGAADFGVGVEMPFGKAPK